MYVKRCVHVCMYMQIFTPLVVFGYTLFAASLLIRVWMLLLALRWEKVTTKKTPHNCMLNVCVYACVYTLYLYTVMCKIRYSDCCLFYASV